MAEVERDARKSDDGRSVWGMGHGTKVGAGETSGDKDLPRLRAPRFFVERDEVVLSANVHNYLVPPRM